MIWDTHPGSQIPDPDFSPSRILDLDLGSKKHRIPDPRSRSATLVKKMQTCLAFAEPLFSQVNMPFISWSMHIAQLLPNQPTFHNAHLLFIGQIWHVLTNALLFRYLTMCFFPIIFKPCLAIKFNIINMGIIPGDFEPAISQPFVVSHPADALVRRCRRQMAGRARGGGADWGCPNAPRRRRSMSPRHRSDPIALVPTAAKRTRRQPPPPPMTSYRSPPPPMTSYRSPPPPMTSYRTPPPPPFDRRRASSSLGCWALPRRSLSPWRSRSRRRCCRSSFLPGICVGGAAGQGGGGEGCHRLPGSRRRWCRPRRCPAGPVVGDGAAVAAAWAAFGHPNQSQREGGRSEVISMDGVHAWSHALVTRK